MPALQTGPKKVAAIHDLSGVGRCALSVVLPVLSAIGVQVCPIPTAILSTHTGGFGDVAFFDLTDFLNQSLSHYKNIGVEFDCVYSGFLGSEHQIDSCLNYFKSYPNALAVVDPVMGDHGKPYRTYTPVMRARMVELVQAADIITPNLTESAMLLGMDYPATLTHSEAKSMLARLSEKGPRQVVITGVPMATGEMANLGYDRERGAFWYVKCNYVPVSYPGTGDVFASVLTGSLLMGDSLPMAMDRATRYVELTIHTTFSFGTDTREGIMLEKTLPWLTERQMVSGFKPL
ncbi:pyridoxine kinase [Acetanaerobacterium elongatum]|uniref:pyridoxal kinase n=2 Tax=Acetanaerobacterium elongatum TaxID=258515 RepID=A0A1H0H489_9FIRM|nr:pyridoxine kinase [Acetanaerobacterium elongatum]